MLLIALKKEVILICVLLSVTGITALARVDNNWSRRPNVTVAQHHGSQPGFRPAVGVGYQPQPAQWNRSNQTLPQQWHQNSNRSQYNQPNYRPGIPNPAQINSYRPQQPAYGQAGVLNQTHPYYRPGISNQTRPSWRPSAGPSYPPVYNQTHPAANNYPQVHGAFNQTRPAWPQPPNAPNYPSYGQGSVNHTRPLPSAPLLPNNPNNKLSAPSSSSNLYPQLPTLNLPQPPAATGNNGIPLAPLQPAPQNPQGPHNWHSGGQAILSYGPGHYPSPVGQLNKNQPNHQGSTNPYANMFI